MVEFLLGDMIHAYIEDVISQCSLIEVAGASYCQRLYTDYSPDGLDVDSQDRSGMSLGGLRISVSNKSRNF
jgi:hypothetical protein